MAATKTSSKKPFALGSSDGELSNKHLTPLKLTPSIILSHVAAFYYCLAEEGSALSLASVVHNYELSCRSVVVGADRFYIALSSRPVSYTHLTLPTNHRV